MMDWTDRHFRFLMRLLTRRTLLYTEMVTTGALLHGPRERLLAFHATEHPLALQLGGDDPGELAACAVMALERGYDEVNLNVGCPSPRVQRGNFGACLMGDPERVAACVAAMKAALAAAGGAGVPVTVKHRIGVDDEDSYEHMERFVTVVAAAGADRFSVHARKAWLQGLSPKENRTVPPLRYPEVHRLKREHPELAVEINGGIRDLDAALRQLQRVDAVMIGRAAYEDPFMMAEADRRVFGEAAAPPTRREVVDAMRPYIAAQLADGVYLSRVSRHLLNLFRAVPGARAWRRHLSENAHRPGAGLEVLDGALALVPDAVLDARPGVPLAV